jgi:hypothetical protein
MPTETTLNETELRTEAFTEGRRVQLADGQEWTFPKPKSRFYPARDANGKFGLGGGSTYDEEYRELMSTYLGSNENDIYARWTIKVQIICHLLLANYSLSDEALAALLTVNFEDESNMGMWQSLTPVFFAWPLDVDEKDGFSVIGTTLD